MKNLPWRSAGSIGLAIASVCAGPSRAEDTAPAVSAAPFDLKDPARIEIGRKRFGSTCAAYCHGSGGEGGRAPSFKGRTDFVPNDAFKTITEGRRGSDVMPPWGNAYKPEEIWELVAYLQFLTTQPPTR